MILKAIHGFDSPQHFSDFSRSIEDAVQNKELAAVPVEQPYASVMFEEHWYLTVSGGLFIDPISQNLWTRTTAPLQRKVIHISTVEDEHFLGMTEIPGHGNGSSF